ncbi:hypothetical protein JVT61DRAFT_5432 [Boletus reticuloceps]|uniref:Ima1 N-terminal domain-containing protein n=1 Tax=Boletus reticuloceps TaxID=495285 RepID=A0A8I3AG19_9AGAM|nr:hypothetical protein JVT61DRAFT_5432 [Boletus reticuloceps]
MAPTSFLRRSSNLACFFCLFDANGEIMSDEPAMHDENLNASSFAKRGLSSLHSSVSTAAHSPPQLPQTRTDSHPHTPNLHSATPVKQTRCFSSTSSQIICHPHRQVPPTNPHLTPSTPTIVSQHPDYAQRLEQLPAYRESLHVRYPPVCANCQPAVQDEIEQKNQMARTKALGGWLKESKGKERRRFASGSAKDRERLGLQLTIWQVRGVLWWTTLLSVLSAHAAAIRGYDFPHSLARVIPVLPVFCLFSFFYTAWDPTYYRFKKARVQGRDVRIKGKTRYVILQVLSWFSRFATSILLVLPRQSSSWDYLHISAYPLSRRVSTYCSLSLLVEFLVFSSSFTILHLQRPPTIRLIETTPLRSTPESSAHSARVSPMPTTPLSNEPDLLASLTLSSKPLMSPTNPVFGRPSLVSQASPIKIDESPDEDAMDWTPTNLSPVKAKDMVDDHDGAWLRPQRFFPPERPTGLESLFANTGLDDINVHSANPTSAAQRDFWNMKAIGLLIATITIILIPLG